MILGGHFDVGAKDKRIKELEEEDFKKKKKRSGKKRQLIFFTGGT